MIDDFNALKHTQFLKNRILEDVTTASMLVEREILQDVATRAPTVDEEYRELNAESGEDALVPRDGDRSADEDDHGRVRFIKAQETYLQNCVTNPINVSRKDTIIKIGNRAFLEKMTHFHYINLGKGSSQIVHEVGPYLDMIEGGSAGSAVNLNGITTFTIEPHGDYPLRPGIGKDGERKSMLKTIRARFMFQGIAIQIKVREIMERVLSTLGGDRAS